MNSSPPPAASRPLYTPEERLRRDRSPWTVVQGILDPLRGTIDAPIGRHPSRDYRFAVVAGGKDSVTHYETLEAFAHGSLVEVHLETGRTHQIRVHVAVLDVCRWRRERLGSQEFIV